MIIPPQSNMHQATSSIPGLCRQIPNARGNALFLILIAVALFGALSYAITQSGRGGGGIAREQALLDKAQLDNYLASVNYGIMKLEQLWGCKIIDFTPPASQGAGDKSCTLFHPDGGRVTYRDFNLDECSLIGKDMATLAIGENCGSLVYAATSSGRRIYALISDSPSQSHNNGTWQASPSPMPSASDDNDGLANTDALVPGIGPYAPFMAAAACRALGPKWYLPARNELLAIYANRNTGMLAGTFSPVQYWTSNHAGNNGWTIDFSTGGPVSRGPNSVRPIRCVRRA